MASFSPTAEGFRLIFRRPSILLAEIAWRWSFAGAAWFLGAMFFIEYANTLPVTRLERVMLGTQQPFLVLRAIQRIFEGSAFRFIYAGVLLAVAMAIAWIVLAALGRSVTLRSVMEDVAFIGARPCFSRRTVQSLLGINFFRAAVSLAALIAAVGSLLLASSMWASTRASVGDATRLWFALLFVTGMAWSVLNWLLATSAIFAVDGQQGIFGSITSVVRVCVQRPGALVAPGSWFGLAHFGVFLFACGAGFAVLGLVGFIGGGATLFLEFLIVLAYCTVADFLHIGRLAAYVSVIYGNDGTVSLKTGEGLPGTRGESASVDASELILSDVPLPAS
jgi:hypothetical protein